MATASVANQGIFTQQSYLPTDSGLLANPIAQRHFANIRKHDLILVTRRIAPRPLPPRDSARVYDTFIKPRKEYVSQKESTASQNLARLQPRPVDTRRQNATTQISGDEVDLFRFGM